MPRPFITILLLPAIVVSCSQPTTVKQEEGFTANFLTYPFDTTAHSIAYYKDLLICGLDNGKVAILDTNYVRRKDLEDSVNRFRILSVFSNNDSIFLYAKKKYYYVDQHFNPRPYLQSKHLQPDLLYEDSTWAVKACCMGEFGGSVFFLNKAEKRMFSYEATCAVQVMKMPEGYLVCSNLAHLGYNTSYYSVKDPKMLYELRYEPSRLYCNWYVDSAREITLTQLPGMRFYMGPRHSMTILNFMQEDSIYSVTTCDTAVYLNVLRDSAYVIKDTLNRNGLSFHDTKVIRAGKKYISLINLTGGSPFAAYWVRGHASGIVVVNEKQIDFLINRKKT